MAIDRPTTERPPKWAQVLVSAANARNRAREFGKRCIRWLTFPRPGRPAAGAAPSRGCCSDCRSAGDGHP